MFVSNSAQNPSFAHSIAAGIPAHGGGKLYELAEAAIWLCSGAANYVFGQMLVVDGGMTVGGFEF